MENNQNEYQGPQPQEQNGGGGFNFRWILYGAVGLYFLYRMFSGGSGDSTNDYVEETLVEPTQGIICELQEQEKDLYKITNEELIDNREDSRIIVTYLDSSIDTFTIDEVKISDASNPRRSMMRSVLMGGMLGYMMGRPMGSGLARSSYASDNSYNKSNTGGRSKLNSTARRTTVRKPSTKSGFGSGKSSRSYGG